MGSIFKYYLSNKRRGFSIILVIALTVFSIYFVTSLVQSIFSTVEYSNIACLEEFSFVYPVGGSSFIESKKVEKIKDDDSVKKTYPILLDYTVINNIFGTTSGYVAFMKAGDIQEIFEEFSLVLEEGRMPEDNEFEIIMHEDMLKNKGLSVGEKFGSAVDDNEYIVGKYTIVGSFSGSSCMAFGTNSFKQSELESLGFDFSKVTFGMLVSPATDLNAMNCMLDNMNDGSISAVTLSSVTKTMKENISNIKLLMIAIVVVVAVSISTAVCIVLETIYNDRMSEFAILHSIGYEKTRLIRNIILEIVILVLISWIFGLFISFVVLNIIGKKVFEPMGQIFSVASLNSFIYTIILVVIFVMITIFVTILNLSKKDLISTIEMR